MAFVVHITLWCVIGMRDLTHNLVAKRRKGLAVRYKHVDHRAIAAQTSESNAMDADSGGICSYNVYGLLHRAI